MDWSAEAEETLSQALAVMREHLQGDAPPAMSVKECIDVAKCAAEIVFESEYGGGIDADGSDV